MTELGRSGRDRWLLYQASIGSPVYDIFAARAEPKLVNYHNITPADAAARLGARRGLRGRAGADPAGPPGAAEPLRRRRLRLQRVGAARARLPGHRGRAAAHRHAGQERRARPGAGGRAGRAARPREGGADLLYVGKISPHKAPHDLVKMLDVLRRTDDPAARLHLVGSPLGTTYEPALRAFVDELGLADAVFLPGSVTGAELEAYFQAADVFVMRFGPRGLLRPAGRGHGPRGAHRRLRRDRGARDGGRRRAWCCPTSPPCRSPPPWGGCWATRLLRRVLAAAGRRRAAAFDLDASTQRSSHWCSRRRGRLNEAPRRAGHRARADGPAPGHDQRREAGRRNGRPRDARSSWPGAAPALGQGGAQAAIAPERSDGSGQRVGVRVVNHDPGVADDLGQRAGSIGHHREARRPSPRATGTPNPSCSEVTTSTSASIVGPSQLRVASRAPVKRTASRRPSSST